MSQFDDIAGRGIVLLGCGRMGGALLRGWLAQGLKPDAVHVIDPHPADWLTETGVQINAELPPDPAVALIAVKPQMMGAALPALRGFGADTLFVTVAAGTTIVAYEAALGADIRLVRTMPNTPSAIGQGITALVGNSAASAEDLDLAAQLMQAVGQVVRLSGEDQMDAVTALSGSGPAYVFHLIEAMTAAGEAEGLPQDLSRDLARATIAGSGALAVQTGTDPAELRANVTSPGGTTAAGLAVLMEELPDLMRRTVHAAAERGRELGK